jgi:putative nucleotidyltransferase with HDIG domain
MGNFPASVKRLETCPFRRWFGRAVVGVTFVSLSATFSARYIWEPQLSVDSVAQSDIKATKTIRVIDEEATRQAKERARQRIPQTYVANPEADENSQKHLEELLQIGDRLRSLAGNMPYASTGILPYNVQVYLRKYPDLAWNALLQQINLMHAQPKLFSPPLLPTLSSSDLSGQAIEALLTSKTELSDVAYQELINAIANARKSYKQAAAKVLEGPEMYREHLLDLKNSEWEADKQALRKALKELLAWGVVPGLPDEFRKYRIEHQRDLPKAPNRRAIATGLLDLVLVSNLEPDYENTEQLALKAESEIKPKFVTLREGQVIVHAGRRVTKKEFDYLDRLGLVQRRPNLPMIAAIVLGVAGAMFVFSRIDRRQSKWLNINLKTGDLAAIGIVSTGTALATVLLAPGHIALVPLASTGLIVGSFYGSRLALLTTTLVSGLIIMSVGVPIINFVPILVGGLLAAGLTNRPHTRSQLAMTGLLVAAAQATTYIACAIFLGNLAPMALALNALGYASGGIIASILALGAIPYLEQLCYAITPIRLAELANLDRPLLRRLVTEAPGTFQHTMFVANLAEAGARELGADTALVRTGTLYHDVGKTLRPEYFIENQLGQTNPHDVLNDPWRSAQIIKEHVTGGLKLAQKYRLPELLQTFIPEHQGTITIAYFYHKAKTQSPETVKESDFRYDGPIPQSRETGIVMLADACEAALRSLGSEVTLAEANEMLMSIFKTRWDDGQLVDAGLTLNDLERIAPVFFRVWQERNHGRIKYPALAQKLDPTGSALPEQKATKVVESLTGAEKL